jgi:uncharacterized protein YndB with AHSA1/START domain
MTASSGTAVVSTPEDTQILITREFNAPAHLVYRCFTEPELVKRWWSGQKGTVTLAEIDLRVGGTWRYVMEATGGFEVGFHGEYQEIVTDERLVYTEAYEGIPDPDGNSGLITLTFTESDGRTTVHMLCEYHNRVTRDIVINSGMESGMQEGMDLLEELAISLA